MLGPSEVVNAAIAARISDTAAMQSWISREVYTSLLWIGLVSFLMVAAWLIYLVVHRGKNNDAADVSLVFVCVFTLLWLIVTVVQSHDVVLLKTDPNPGWKAEATHQLRKELFPGVY